MTVQETINALSQLPKDTELYIRVADMGYGDDVAVSVTHILFSKEEVVLNPHEHKVHNVAVIAGVDFLCRPV